LNTQANQIDEPALRKKYLTNLPENQDLLRLIQHN
jgi:hypothetical protein